MSLPHTRFDPGLTDPAELDRLAQVVAEEERPALVGHGGERIPLPDPIFRILVETVQAMQEGRTFVLVPEDELCTTQAAADFLGVSRPYLVGLLDAGRIPHHRVGSHRRVYFRDLRAYLKKRDGERRSALDNLFDEANAAGLIDAGGIPEHEV